MRQRGDGKHNGKLKPSPSHSDVEAYCAHFTDFVLVYTLTQLLFLNNNNIGDDGMRSLADAFAKGALPQLQKLILSRNQIGDEGMAALADAIKPVSAGGSGAMANTKVSSKPSHSCSGLRLTAHLLLTLLFCTH